MKPYQYLLIDADDTLFDFEAAEARALRLTFEAFEIAYTQANIEGYGQINKQLWRDLEKGLIDQEGLKVERFKRFLESIEHQAVPQVVSDRYIIELGKGTDLLPGALELVQSLSAVYPICIVTNGIEAIQTARISHSKIASYIRHVVISETVGKSKPDPSIFTYAMALIGIQDKSKLIMIGDSLSSDIQGGINAGIDTCWVNLKGQPEPETCKPTMTVTSLEEIAKRLL